MTVFKRLGVKIYNKDKHGNMSLEELEDRGIMDERDVDYLNHLEVPLADEVAVEGILRSVVHQVGSFPADAYRELKGYFLGIETKRKYIEEICTDLIDWLKDKQTEYRDLNLDMGSFKTWMKTSESFFWRYYFLLNDSTWAKIEGDLKAGRITSIETLTDINFRDRIDIARYLDSIADVKDLIKIVDLYITRSNKFFKLILERKIKIKSFPFQVILLGATDLRKTVKKIVNLAI